MSVKLTQPVPAFRIPKGFPRRRHPRRRRLARAATLESGPALADRLGGGPERDRQGGRPGRRLGCFRGPAGRWPGDRILRGGARRGGCGGAMRPCSPRRRRYEEGT